MLCPKISSPVHVDPPVPIFSLEDMEEAVEGTNLAVSRIPLTFKLCPMFNLRVDDIKIIRVYFYEQHSNNCLSFGFLFTVSIMTFTDVEIQSGYRLSIQNSRNTHGQPKERKENKTMIM